MKKGDARFQDEDEELLPFLRKKRTASFTRRAMDYLGGMKRGCCVFKLQKSGLRQAAAPDRTHGLKSETTVMISHEGGPSRALRVSRNELANSPPTIPFDH